MNTLLHWGEVGSDSPADPRWGGITIMNKNFQGGSTPVSIFLGDLQVTESNLDYEKFNAVYQDLFRMWKKVQQTHSLLDVQGLSGMILDDTVRCEQAMADYTFNIEGYAFEMGFSLKTGEKLRP